MADCVIDTNIAVKWVLAEPDSADASRVMDDVTKVGGRLFLLDIALVEAANVIWVYQHRGKHSASDATRLFAALRQSPITLIPATNLLDDAMSPALQFDITVYDASFVAAVKQMGCLGATADAPLLKKIGAAFPSIKLLKKW